MTKCIAAMVGWAQVCWRADMKAGSLVELKGALCWVVALQGRLCGWPLLWLMMPRMRNEQTSASWAHKVERSAERLPQLLQLNAMPPCHQQRLATRLHRLCWGRCALPRLCWPVDWLTGWLAGWLAACGLWRIIYKVHLLAHPFAWLVSLAATAWPLCMRMRRGSHTARRFFDHFTLGLWHLFSPTATLSGCRCTIYIVWFLFSYISSCSLLLLSLCGR